MKLGGTLRSTSVIFMAMAEDTTDEYFKVFTIILH